MIYHRRFTTVVISLVYFSKSVSSFLFTALDKSSFKLQGVQTAKKNPPMGIHAHPISFTKMYLSTEKELERGLEQNNISIEYCTGCRWMFRSFWLAQELLTTFQDELTSITLIPSKPPSPGGIFSVTFNGCHVLWDRKSDGGFPEAKQLKQRVRDSVAPKKNLGHSDNVSIDNKDDANNCEECKEDGSERETTVMSFDHTIKNLSNIKQPNISIEYCIGCQWLLRSAWFGQELLSTFQENLNSVTLVPSRPPSPGGQFVIKLNNQTLWDRSEEGRFPEIKELKQMVRDKIDPNLSLGHSDVAPNLNFSKDEITDLDDDEAAELRNFYGVL